MKNAVSKLWYYIKGTIVETLRIRKRVEVDVVERIQRIEEKDVQARIDRLNKKGKDSQSKGDKQ